MSSSGYPPYLRYELRFIASNKSSCSFGLVWLISHGWKYCWLIWCERKILFVSWKRIAYKPNKTKRTERMLLPFYAQQLFFLHVASFFLCKLEERWEPFTGNFNHFRCSQEGNLHLSLPFWWFLDTLLMDGSVCLCGVCGWGSARCFGPLAAFCSRSGGSEKVKGFSVIFSLGFVCISSDFF